MSERCAKCGKTKAEHHAFLRAMPKGCVCDPNGWGGTVKAVCAVYQGGGDESCRDCEHDLACHEVRT